MATPVLPRAQSELVRLDRVTQPEWLAFFRNLRANVESNTSAVEQIDAILARLEAVEGGSASTGAVQGDGSVVANGQLADGLVVLSLENDADSPAATSYYGTDSAGAKGWFQRLLSSLADVDLATTPPAVGDALVHDGTTWVPGAVDSAVPFFIPDGETYTVAANKQALYALPIELDGDAVLIVDGALVEVG